MRVLKLLPKHLLYATLPIVCGFTLARAQGSSTVVASKDPQAVAIVTQAIAAMGPAVSTIQDSLTTATITYYDGSSGALTIKTRGQLLRHEIGLPNGSLVYVINPVGSYMLNNGKRSALPLWATKYQLPEHIPALGRLIQFSLPNMQLNFVGQETINNQAVYHILLYALPTDATSATIEKMLSEFHFFVDASTYQIVKSRGYIFSPDAIENRSVVENSYSDYRSVNGITVPFHIVRTVSGQPYCEITLTNVAFNVGLSASDFQ